MLIYITFNDKTGTNKSETDANFRDLAGQITALDGIRMDELSGQKSLAGAEIIAAEVIKTGAVTKIAEVIGGWLLKDRSRSLKLKIGDNELDVSGLNEKEQQDLIEWFQKQASRHTNRRK